MPMNRNNQHSFDTYHFDPLKINELNWYTEQDIPTEIPVLDFQRLTADKDWDILRKCLCQGKIFYLKNLGVSDEETEAFLNTTRAFYNQPKTERMKIIHPSLTNIWRGYSSFRARPEDSNLGNSESPEVTMNYTWGSYDNVSPNETFRKIWQAYYIKKSNNIRKMTEIIIDALDLKQTNEWEKLLGGEILLRHQSYPAIPLQGQFRMAAHVDTTVISLLSQIPAENGHIGLEVWTEDQFVRAPAVKGTAVINIGEVLHAFTQGVVKPTMHRVINPAENLACSERTSIPVFLHAAQDLEIEPPQGTTYADFYNAQGKTTVSTFLSNAVKAFTRR